MFVFDMDLVIWGHIYAAVTTGWEIISQASKPPRVELEMFELDLSSWQQLTHKALWDGEGSIITGAGHRVAAPVFPVQTIEDNVLSVEDSVGFQVSDPELLGVIEDTTSFDANSAGSWVENQSSQYVFTRHFNSTHRTLLSGWNQKFWRLRRVQYLSADSPSFSMNRDLYPLVCS